jgi:hypothetical protein
MIRKQPEGRPTLPGDTDDGFCKQGVRDSSPQVELTTGDLRAIDDAAAAISVAGDRYPEAMPRMIDR